MQSNEEAMNDKHEQKKLIIGGVEMPEWPATDYYDCRDVEELTHESLEEAIEYYIDSFCTPGCDVLKVIGERCPVRVTCYDRMVLDEEDYTDVAEACAETAVSLWEEDWGPPDEIAACMVEQKDIERALPKFIEAIKELYAEAEVYPCKPVFIVEFSEEQVEALMRHYRDDWFENEEDAKDGKAST